MIDNKEIEFHQRSQQVTMIIDNKIKEALDLIQNDVLWDMLETTEDFWYDIGWRAGYESRIEEEKNK